MSAASMPAESAHRTQRDTLSLPKGAMAVPLSPAFHSNAGPSESAHVSRPDTPPATSTQPLLEPASTPTRIQFATYRGDSDFSQAEKHRAPSSPPSRVNGEQAGPEWKPLPLRLYFWLPLVVFLVFGAIGLEIALHFSKKNNGWRTKNDFQTATRALHYLYTLPPVIVAAIIAALWTWTDIEIKKLQPYVSLVHGDAPPHKSLLLDYTRNNNFVVWSKAAGNRHYLVAAASILVLVSMAFQPLAAALITVRDTWASLPDMTVNQLAVASLNQDGQFRDLTTFVTGSGFAASSVLYNLPEAPFTKDAYTLAPIEMPSGVVKNGTVVFVNTTAVKSESGCRPVPVEMTRLEDGSGWSNLATFDTCAIRWSVDRRSVNLFGTDVLNCTEADNREPEFSHVVFWFFTYQPEPAASATFCKPSISLWDVSAQIDLSSGNVTQVRELQPFSASSNFSSLAANITGEPLRGRAMNGVAFNMTDADPFVLARLEATRLQLPAAVFQSAVQSPEGLVGSFQADRFVALSTRVYTTYLKLIASSIYFVRRSEANTIQLKTVEKRVFLTDVATHLLAAGMLLLAVGATVIQLLHRASRRNLRMQHEPGTIASAISIGAQTNMGELLAGRQKQDDMRLALKDKKFKIDPRTMRIVMEGEDGYEWAATPVSRQKSIFGGLQSSRMSRRFSAAPSTPQEAA